MEDDPFPQDFGAKIHPSHPTDRELYAHRPDSVPFVACKFHRSSWFRNQPRIWFLHPEQDLFVTTYENDEYLLGRTPTDEVNRYQKLEGVVDGVFPGDRFTYHEITRRELVKEIEESVQRQLTVQELMDDRGIDIPVYPCIMGWKDWHFERCRELVENISASVGFDATQYNSEYRLANHIETMEEVLGVDRIFLNGCVSPKWLRMLPKSVVACSGSYNIRKEAEDWSGTVQSNRIPEITQKRVDALNNCQSEITRYL